MTLTIIDWVRDWPGIILAFCTLLIIINLIYDGFFNQGQP